MGEKVGQKRGEPLGERAWYRRLTGSKVAKVGVATCGVVVVGRDKPLEPVPSDSIDNRKLRQHTIMQR